MFVDEIRSMDNTRSNSTEYVSAHFNKLTFSLDPTLACENRVVKSTLSCWRSICGDREMPSRSEIGPTILPPFLLPHLILIDVERNPEPRFRWRLIGTYIVDRLGRDSTGKYWDEIYDVAVYNELSKGVSWVLQHRRPVRTIGFAPVEGKKHLSTESIVLPLSTNGNDIDIIMVAAEYG